MTERVRLAGGTIRIDSRPSGGCRVTASLPIAATDPKTSFEPPPAAAPPPGVMTAMIPSSAAEHS